LLKTLKPHPWVKRDKNYRQSTMVKSYEKSDNNHREKPPKPKTTTPSYLILNSKKRKTAEFPSLHTPLTLSLFLFLSMLYIVSIILCNYIISLSNFLEQRVVQMKDTHWQQTIPWAWFKGGIESLSHPFTILLYLREKNWTVSYVLQPNNTTFKG